MSREHQSAIPRSTQEYLAKIAHELGWKTTLVKQQPEENFAVYELEKGWT